jgi:hypothetical protein
MILTEKEIEEAFQMSERIMKHSKRDESAPSLTSLAKSTIKLAATTLEVKRRFKRKYPDGHFPMTKLFASSAEETHAVLWTFLEQGFRDYAELLVVVVEAYVSLITENVKILSESLDYEVSGHAASEEHQDLGSTQDDAAMGKARD